jgi:RNA polymerase sigma-70 factor (ECF subfamily)
VTDAELLRSWRDGDRAAGQALVSRHYDAVFGFLRARVDATAAEDLAQAVFELVCKKSTDFRGDSSFRAFLFGVARMKVLAHARLHTRADAVGEPLDPDAHDAAQRTVSSLVGLEEERAVVARALRCLDADDQLLLELRICERFTEPELCEFFDLSRSKLRRRVEAARSRFEKALREAGRRPGLVDSTVKTLAGHIGDLLAAER